MDDTSHAFDDFIKSPIVIQCFHGLGLESSFAVLLVKIFVEPRLLTPDSAPHVVAFLEEQIYDVRCDIAVRSCNEDHITFGKTTLLWTHGENAVQ